MKNYYVRTYLIYILVTRSFESLINEPTKLKMMEYGVDKNTLVNLTGLVVPLEIILSLASKKYLTKGKMIKYYHFFLSLVGVSIVFKYLINKYLLRLDLVGSDGRKKELPNLAMFLIVFESIFYCVTKLKYVFLMGFRNLIVDEELGNTSMTLVTSTWFLSLAIPDMLGLWMIEFMSYDLFMLIGLFGTFGGLVAS